MIIKVCGLTKTENYNAIVQAGADMTGINFYAPSSRYIDDRILPRYGKELRAGIFVQSDIEEIRRIYIKYDLDLLQLHGDEDEAYCRAARDIGPIIKVWRIDSDFNWSTLKNFHFCNYFLFDTKVKEYGGSGHKFKWSQLKQYHGEVPFILSGGIGPDDVEAIKNLNHPQFHGIDINSKFEDTPGMKNVDVIRRFIKELRN